MKYSNIFQAALRQLAAQHDLPELLAGRIVEMEQNGLLVEVDVQPRGQLAAIVCSLKVRVRFDMDPTRKKVGYLNMDFTYKHQGGGSNGKSVDYMILTDNHYGAEEQFVGLVERCLFDGLANRFYSSVEY